MHVRRYFLARRETLPGFLLYATFLPVYLPKAFLDYSVLKFERYRLVLSPAKTCLGQRQHRLCRASFFLSLQLFIAERS